MFTLTNATPAVSSEDRSIRPCLAVTPFFALQTIPATQLFYRRSVPLYMQTLNAKLHRTAKLAMLLSTALVFGFAARDASADDHPRVEEVNGRYHNQQERIANGVGSGALNARETSRLEGREAALKTTERQDRLNHNGHLTRQEQANLNHRENRISRSIYRDKHN